MATSQYQILLETALFTCLIKASSMNENDGPWLDTVHELLSESRRRQVLYYFLQTEHATVNELAHRLVSRERNVPIDSIDSGETTEITIALHHKHLPKLERHDVIEYDEHSDDVVRGSGFEGMAEFVRRARELEATGGRFEDSSGSSTSVAE
ncbi:DUF7344 domain-containing protein [Natronobacterium lacisalsi]|uniref:DUF7344 domain-containing protein n=1 Tax=Natronobacterium lacisalsi TaxID=229731 RepID=UPI001EE70A10|nr:hypothetical protein [Halobiforma lacisalsi]